MNLPKHIIDKYKFIGENSEFYGCSIKDFTRDELLACIGWLSNKYHKSAKEIEESGLKIVNAMNKLGLHVPKE